MKKKLEKENSKEKPSRAITCFGPPTMAAIVTYFRQSEQTLPFERNAPTDMDNRQWRVIFFKPQSLTFANNDKGFLGGHQQRDCLSHSVRVCEYRWRRWWLTYKPEEKVNTCGHISAETEQEDITGKQNKFGHTLTLQKRITVGSCCNE